MARPKTYRRRVRINLAMEETTKRQLSKLAFDRGLSISAVISQLVSTALANPNPTRPGTPAV